MNKCKTGAVVCSLLVFGALVAGIAGCSPQASTERKTPDEVSTSIVSDKIGVDAYGNSALFDFDCAANAESASLSKYGWFELTDGGSHLVVSIPANPDYEYGYGIFNDEIATCDSEAVSDGMYTLTFSGAKVGHTSLRFTAYTKDTGRVDGSAVINVGIDGGGKITVYETSYDYSYAADRFDCIPV